MKERYGALTLTLTSFFSSLLLSIFPQTLRSTRGAGKGGAAEFCESDLSATMAAFEFVSTSMDWDDDRSRSPLDNFSKANGRLTAGQATAPVRDARRVTTAGSTFDADPVLLLSSSQAPSPVAVDMADLNVELGAKVLASVRSGRTCATSSRTRAPWHSRTASSQCVCGDGRAKMVSRRG